MRISYFAAPKKTKEAVSISEQRTGEEIYNRFTEGDTDALEELVALYRNGLMFFINGFVHDMDEAEELMIDVFAQLVASGKQFEGRSTLKTYLFAIGRNLALKHLRKSRRAVYTAFGNTNVAAMDSLETGLLLSEQKREVYAGLRSLKPQYGEVLYLLYFEDMSYAEAGKVLKKTEGQIAGLAYRAKAALRLKLESEGFNYP